MGLKNAVKQHMVNKHTLEYEKRLSAKKRPYSQWIVEKEEKEGTSKLPEDCNAAILSFEGMKHLSSKEMLKVKKSKFVICHQDKGVLSEQAVRIIGNVFLNSDDAVVVYGDEDVREKDEERKMPWYKPDWSPTTYCNYFYFGSVIAIRSEEFLWSYQPDISIYELCNKVLYKCGAFGKRPEAEKVVHVPQILFHAAKASLYEEYKQVRYDVEPPTDKNTFVSIIIPSKNNREVLNRCVDSVIETVPRGMCEIIVVDNGSEEKEKEAISEMLSLKLIRTTYIYEPMEFNFSKMCNLGVSKAKGDIVLLLNDDLSCINNDWFEKMRSYVMLSYVGAVGIKLHYPDSDRIQHAGIVNVKPGPVHKLQYLVDQEDYYYGTNTKDHNVIAVTGAALMVRRDVWNEIKGLDEELEVAFNDVDFCYTLWEKGYYNVVVEKAFLYHHESLSRGRDEEEGKLKRLIAERNLLYKRHPELEGWDPFYSAELNNRWLDVKIRPALGNEEAVQIVEGKTLEKGLPKNVTEDECLSLAIELAREDAENIIISGYGVVLGSNNACFQKSLLLQNGGTTYRIPIEEYYRPDIEENMPDQICVALSGFCVKIPRKLLPDGEYRIGMMAEDRTSRLKLINWSKRYITRKE